MNAFDLDWLRRLYEGWGFQEIYFVDCSEMQIEMVDTDGKPCLIMGIFVRVERTY